MDFIEGLSKSEGCDVIMVVVDRLTKYAHLLPLKHPYIAIDVARVYTSRNSSIHDVFPYDVLNFVIEQITSMMKIPG